MLRSAFKKRWLYVQGLTVLGLLVPIGCYFFIYLPSQQAYFANRNFRVLALTGDQLKARLENAAKALQYLARTTSTNESNPEGRIKLAMELIPNLTLARVSTNSLPPVETKTDLNPSAQGAGKSPSITNDFVEFNIEPDLSASVLTFQYTTTNKPTLSIQARADFNSFLTIRPEFDGLLVAQQDGTVLFQRSLEAWRVLNVLTLVDAKGQKVATNLSGQSSRMMTVNLTGTEYKLFLQPLQISSNVGGTASQWWVCGAVRSGRFAAESLAIRHTYLVGFIFLVLLSAAVLPFAKLLLMGPRERLSKLDVFFLMLSTVGGSATLVLLLLNVYTYEVAEDILDSRLKDFAANIVENLETEVVWMHQQLTKFRDRSVAGTASNYAENPRWKFFANVLANTNIIDPTNHAVDPYPYFEQVGWAPASGLQTQKWTVRFYPTPFLSIRGRNYFRDALEHRHSLYEFRQGTTNFWLESILSWNTGESSAIMSVTNADEVVYMESKLLSLMRPIVPPGFGFCVIANDGRVLFHSEMERNLQENLLLECDNAPALRAALMGGASGETFDVNYHGKIHSFYIRPIAGFNWSLAVFRNEYLLNSADFDLLLISLYLFCFYLGLLMIIWLVLFHWILREGVDWLWPQERKGQSYGLSFAGSTLVGLGSLVAIALVPDPKTETLIGLAAAGLAAGLFYLSPKFSWRVGKSFNSSRHEVSYVRAIVSFVLVVAAVPAFAFFKASYDAQVELFVKHGQLHFAKALQERSARVENDYQRIKIGTGELQKNLFLEDRLQITNQWTQHLPLDLYQQCFFDTELELPVARNQTNPPDPDEPDFFKAFLAKLRPFHYRTGSESQGLFRETAVDNSYKWERETDTARGRPNAAGLAPKAHFTLTGDHRRLVLHKNNFHGEQHLHVRSTLPELFGFRAFPIKSILLVISGIAFCVVIFYLVRFVARQVFLLDIIKEPRSRHPAKHALVLSSNRVPAELTSSPFINWCSGSDELKAQLENLKTELAKDDHTEKTITFLHFEREFQNGAFNQQKLDLLEGLIMEGRHNLRVYSAVDPSHFRVLDPGAKAAESTATSTLEDASAVEQNRWDSLFRFFVREHPVRKGNSAAPEAQDTQASSPSIEKGILPEDRPDYRSLWLTFSKPEQLVLYQLAKEGFINAKNPELPGLLASHVIRRDPELKLADERFRRFVLTDIRPEDLRSREQAEPDSQWSKIKVPFQTCLLALALLILVTQRELFDLAVQVIGVFVTSVPTLFNLFNLFQKNPAKK